jgi:hypothetical protein
LKESWIFPGIVFRPVHRRPSGQPVKRTFTPDVIGYHERLMMNQMRGVLQQKPAFMKGFEHQGDVSLLKVTDAAVLSMRIIRLIYSFCLALPTIYSYFITYYNSVQHPQKRLFLSGMRRMKL